jgi:hypothetical protein
MPDACVEGMNGKQMGAIITSHVQDTREQSHIELNMLGVQAM